MTSNIKKTAYNLFFGIGSQMLIAVVGIIIPRLFITSFGSEVNGFLSSINQVFTYIVLLEAGVGTATLQALYKPIATNDREKVNGIMSATAQFYRRTGLCYLACVVLLAIIYPLFIESQIPVWQQVAVILIVGGSNSIGYFVHGKLRMLLRADGRSYAYTNAYTLVQLGTNVTKIVMILLGLNIVFVQLGHMVLLFLLAGYIKWYCKRHYPWLNLKAKPDKAAISQKNSVLVHEISQMVFNHTDILILTIFTDLRVVSIYTIYIMVVDIISTLIGNVHNSFSFRLGQIFNTDKARYTKIYELYELGIIIFSMLLYCITYNFLLPFIGLYTAGITDINYVDKWLPVLFVSIKLLVSGRMLASATIGYAGYFKQTKNRALLETLINLVVSLATVPVFGIYGVLFGTIAALLYRTNDIIIFTRRRILHNSPIRSYSKWLVNLFVFVLVSYATVLLPVQAENYFALLGWCICYSLGYTVFFGLVNFLVFQKDVRKIFSFVQNYLSGFRKKLKRTSK